MRILKINLDYKNELNNKGVLDTPQEISDNYINFAFHQKYPQGVEGQLKRVIGRIQRKLIEAIDKKLDNIKLEEAEFEMIKKAMEMAKYPTEVCKYVMVLEDALENAKIEG